MAAGEREKKTGKGRVKKKFKGQWKGIANKLSIGNKERGHAFVEARKRKALKEYKKLLKKARHEHSAEQRVSNSGEKTQSSPVGSDAHDGGQALVGSDARDGGQALIHRHDGDFQSTRGKESNSRRKRKSMTRFTTAENEFKKRKQERIQQIKEQEEERKKRAELQKKKLKERRQNFNRHNRRTRKGQPVMSTQIEDLLQKIQT